MQDYGYDYIILKDYKGYGITKVVKVDFYGKNVPGSAVYCVSDDDDYIGSEYKTLAEAKKFVNECVRREKIIRKEQKYG